MKKAKEQIDVRIAAARDLLSAADVAARPGLAAFPSGKMQGAGCQKRMKSSEALKPINGADAFKQATFDSGRRNLLTKSMSSHRLHCLRAAMDGRGIFRLIGSVPASG